MPVWIKDTFERLVKTFLQAFLAQLTASGVGFVEIIQDTSTLERAGLAGLAAVYSLVFSVVSTWANRRSPAPPTTPDGRAISPASLARA